MTNKKYRNLIIGIIVVLGLVGSGCSKEVTTIRIGVNDWPPCEVWYVAKEQGFFEDVNVELVRFTAWSDNMKALYKGNIDITHSTYFNNILHSGQFEKAMMIAPIDTIAGSDGLVIHNDLESISDLIGKKIAVEIGTDEHYLLFRALEMNDVSLDDVEIYSTTSAETVNYFAEGQVDGIFTYEPYLSQAAEMGDGKIVFTTNELENHMVDVLLGRQTKVEEEQKAYEQVMKAWYKALEYIEEHPEVYEMMAQNEQLSAEDFGPFFESFQFFNKNEAKVLMGEAEFDTIQSGMRDFVIEHNLNTNPQDLDAIINKKIIESIQ